MARARITSIAHRAGCNQPFLNHHLRRWFAKVLRQLQPVVVASAARCNAERYRKHFHSFAHLCLLLFHGLSGNQSLRQSYAAFAVCPGMVSLSGLAVSDDPEREALAVSFSQFADSNTTRPAAFLGGLVPFLVARVRRYGDVPASSLPPDIHILDSTFLRLSLLLAPWLPNKGGADVPGVRVQLQYSPVLDLPEHVLITDSHTNDCQRLDQAILDDPSHLAALRDQTLVFDLGYYSHRRFAGLLAAGVHLITRLKTQAKVQVEADLPVQSPLPDLPAGRITILSDQRVTVGSAENKAGAVLSGLRLVTARVEPLPKAARAGAEAVLYRILTDRWDLDAADVIQIYLWRWQIELFLRWLKSHVHLPRLLGYSRNAVELTVWLAIIVHLLSVLAARSLGLFRRSPGLLRQIVWALAKVGPADASEIASDVQQLPLPGLETGLPPPT